MLEILNANALCTDCYVNDGNIEKRSFSCNPESPLHVIYRARLEGTSARGSSYLITLLEDWVRGGAGIVVSGVLMKVDQKCSVAITSLSDEECIAPTTGPSTPNMTDSTGGSTPDESSSISNTLTVVIVLVVLIIAISIIVLIVVILVLRNRRSKYSTKNSAGNE